MKNTYNLIIILIVTISLPISMYSQDLRGKTELMSLRKNEKYAWFGTNYAATSTDSATIAKLKPLWKNVKLVVFAGTWCSDTKYLLPKFTAVLDQSAFDFAHLELYMLDIKKTSAEQTEKKYGIEYLPTFIFFKNGKELGRIVETIQKPIEKVVFDILNQ